MKQKAPEYKEAEEAIRLKLSKELPGDLSYHGLHHTEDVLNAALKIAKTEKVPGKDLKLLRLAILLHDSGFIHTYKGHEEMGCKIAREILPAYHLPRHEIEVICGMIMATKIPQTPDTILERIICDADLDYLGRDDVFAIADTLFHEIKLYINPISADEWNNLQISFLEAHEYFTKFSKTKRSPAKLIYLNHLKANHIAV